MKKLSLLILCMRFLFGWAQMASPSDEFNVAIGPEMDTGKKEYVDKIIGGDEENFYAYSLTDGWLTIFSYSHDLKVFQRHQTKLKIHDQNADLRAFVKLGHAFYLFASQLNKKRKTSVLYAQRLNVKTLILEPPIEVFESSYEGYKKYQSATFDYLQSKDSNLVMFIANLPMNKSENYKFGALVIDVNLQVVWKKRRITLPYPQTDFYPYYAELTGQGELQMLGKIFTSMADKSTINYRFEYFTFNGDSDDLNSLPLEIRDYHISDIIFQNVGAGKKNFVGFYSSSGKGQNGVFNILTEGDDLAVVNESYTEFPVDFIVQHSTEQEKRRAAKRNARGKEVEFFSLDLHELILNPDSTLTVVAEQQRYYQTCTTSQNGPTTCVNHYIRGNIVTVKFNDYGQVEWMDLMPKYQHTTNDLGFYSGYALSQNTDGTINYIFNDHSKNAYFQKTGRLLTWNRNQRSTDVVLYQLDSEGEAKRRTLYYADKYDIMCRPMVATQLRPNQQIIISHSRRITRFVEVRFE